MFVCPGYIIEGILVKTLCKQLVLEVMINIWLGIIGIHSTFLPPSKGHLDLMSISPGEKYSRLLVYYLEYITVVSKVCYGEF